MRGALEEHGILIACDFLATHMGETVAEHVGEGGKIRQALGLLVSEGETDGTTTDGSHQG